MEKIKHQSVVFSWNTQDFDNLVRACEYNDEIDLTLKYLKNSDARILEAGCGLGGIVKYLFDKGFHRVEGLELNQEIVKFLNMKHPELKVSYGDILFPPYRPGSFDVVLSYGVIEHFPFLGPLPAMHSMYNLLKPGGIAVVTIPSLNLIRRMKYYLDFLDFRKMNFIRKIFGKKILHRNKKRFAYYVQPQYGDFFEYRFTPSQFENICKKSGFEIIESVPTAHIDGLYHTLGHPLVAFDKWKFSVSGLGSMINKIFKLVPFFHNHMHACVLRKPRINVNVKDL